MRMILFVFVVAGLLCEKYNIGMATHIMHATLSTSDDLYKLTHSRTDEI